MAKLSKDLIKLINSQINAELYSAYIYADISNFYYEKGFTGFGHWFKIQAHEEVGHAEKFIDYLHDNSEVVELAKVEKPEFTYKTLKDPLVKQLEHEEFVTSLIYKLVDQAKKDNDYRSIDFLNWYVKEQFEEEMNARNLLEEFNFIEKDVAAIVKMNHELGERK